MTTAPQHADRFELLPPHLAEPWSQFGRWEQVYFPSVVGLELEEVRSGYGRMRLPYRPELQQPAGVVHGGAIATLIDTVVVPAQLRAELVARFAAARSKDRTFSRRRHGITPV